MYTLHGENEDLDERDVAGDGQGEAKNKVSETDEDDPNDVDVILHA